jgi:hypothetical protein
VGDQNADFTRELTVLEGELKKLETEYNMYFSGRLARPPWETRSRVDGMVRRLDRTPITNYGLRFRFTTLQTRFNRFLDLWDRALRAREEGRRGPLSYGRQAEPPPPERIQDRIVAVTTMSDPAAERDKLQSLYKGLMEARQQAGQERIPFERFAELVRAQVTALRDKGGAEVAFRVALKDGKVAFSARALRGAAEPDQAGTAGAPPARTEPGDGN